jgi:hypothetical protein
MLIAGRSFTEPMEVAELATAAYALRVANATALWGSHGRKLPGRTLVHQPRPERT